LFLKIGVVVIAACGQLSFGMELLEKSFMRFSALPLDMQALVMKHSNNYCNVQLVNKHCAKKVSIKASDIFASGFCNIDKNHMARILFNAVYKKNYEGVKNIITTTNLCRFSQGELCSPYLSVKHSADNIRILDLHDIATHNNDEKMKELLKSYNIAQFSEKCIRYELIDLVMACYIGDSESVKDCLDDIHENSKKNAAKITHENIENALSVAIYGDYGKCVKVFIDNLYFDNNVGDIGIPTTIKLSLRKHFLYDACRYKKINALKELLVTKAFGFNKIEYNQTFLDIILPEVQRDPGYNAVALLLRDYGAKTAEELDKEEEMREDLRKTFSSPAACTIS
jgi:hypothetical protein